MAATGHLPGFSACPNLYSTTYHRTHLRPASSAGTLQVPQAQFGVWTPLKHLLYSGFQKLLEFHFGESEAMGYARGNGIVVYFGQSP